MFQTKKEREARAKEKRMEKKLKQKALFDRNYDLNKDGKLVSTVSFYQIYFL